MSISSRDGRREVIRERSPFALLGHRRLSAQRAPQDIIDSFWAAFTTKTPGKATSIIPQRVYAEKAARRASGRVANGGQSAAASYAEAYAQCQAKVAQIVKECRRVNQKYRDPHFDLELDLMLDRHDCLLSLSNARASKRHVIEERRAQRHGRRAVNEPSAAAEVGAGDTGAGPKHPTMQVPMSEADHILSDFNPKAVKRVADIFDNPQLFIDGPTANDVRQGRDGDCWLMAALCTMGNKPGLIERVCVAHDAAVGVYGFVFHRDGEWFSEIIDDKLYLTKPDYDESRLERILFDDRVRVNSEEAYRKLYQTNSGALYFAQCEDPNETWLPLLEKAYAKAHGDYAAIEGGYTGEGIEDLTGGVTSELYTTDILDKEYFWREELMKVNQTFLFGCSTGVWGRGHGDRGGVVEQHAYSVMRAVEMDGVRLVLLKNPWGRHEWKGAWSDGSKEWTAAWIEKLDHRFGDDGSFWISYADLLRTYQAFDRTRLFGDDDHWSLARIWTTMTVPWTLEYNDTKFAFSLARRGPVVIVLSQLDSRYFRGLEGQYRFSLSFRLHRTGEGSSTGDGDDAYVVRSPPGYRMSRSVSVELELDAGSYLVLVKIDAERDDAQLLPPEDVVRANARTRREKLIRIGLAYDLAHSKARSAAGETPTVAERRAARKAHKAAAARRERRTKEQMRKQIMEERRLNHRIKTFTHERKRKKLEKQKKKQEAARADKQQREKEAMEAMRKGKEEAEKDKADAGRKDEMKEMEVKDPVEKKESDNVKEVGKEGEGEAEGEAEGEKDSQTKAEGNSEEKEDGKGADTVPSPKVAADEKADDNTTSEPKENDATDLTADAPTGDTGTTSSPSGSSQKDTPADSVVSDKVSLNTEPEARTDKENNTGPSQSEGQTRTETEGGRETAPHDQPTNAAAADEDRGPDIGGSPPPHRWERGRRDGGNDGYDGNDGNDGNEGRWGANRWDDEEALGSVSSLSEISDEELDLIYEQRRIHVREPGRGRAACGGRRDPRRDSLSPSLPLSSSPPPRVAGSSQHAGRRRRRRRRATGPVQILHDDSDGGRWSEDEAYVGAPWNAVAVVGLRVYYQEMPGDAARKAASGGVDEIVTLRVERPHAFAKESSSDSEDSEDSDESDGDDSDDRDGDKTKRGAGDDNDKGEEKELDVDDSLKDATVPVQQKKKESRK